MISWSVAGAWLTFPGWAWEHRLLLNGGASAHALISQGVSLMSGPSPAEVAQGMGQLGHLLAAHWRRNPIVPGTWVDAGEPLPSYDERVAAVVASMEAAAGTAGASIPGGSGTSTGTGEGSSGAPGS